MGYWYEVREDYPNGKYINYHAGPAKSVNMEKYPLISLSNDDPLFVLKKYLSGKELNKISSRIFTQLESEVL